MSGINLSKTYADTIPELILAIENLAPYQTAAFKVRAKKILHSLER